MAKRNASTNATKPIEQYTHSGKDRVNNPPIGLVTPETDKGDEKQKYEYDPHLDPQLEWAGKAEHTSFEIPTVSLHVHERIDPRSIIEAVRRKPEEAANYQPSLFQTDSANLPFFKEVEFYKHRHNWSNRLIAGDSLLVMNSLLVKEGMAGSVQMVYFDPPYGIKYGSNFQPFVNRRDVKDGKDDDLTSEPETLKAFRDTWELGIHSYLTYLRDRLLLAREMLAESGSIFVQISDENVHLVRNLMDEVFGAENFVSNIIFEKTTSASSTTLSSIADTVIFYAKKKSSLKYRQIFKEKVLGESGTTQYVWIESPDKTEIKRLSSEELNDTKKIPAGWRVLAFDNLTSQRPAQGSDVLSYEYEGQSFTPGKGTFKTDKRGLDNIAAAKRLKPIGKSLMYKRYLDDFLVSPIANVWRDVKMTGFSEDKLYVVQTSQKVIQRCMLMTTDPSDLVLDITCGSGTTAFVAEQWGRRWITCDTSRVALTLTKQRLMTASFDYFQLAKDEEGVSSGFKYKTVPHVTLKSIANNEPAAQETLYDQPLKDKERVRVTSPFTVEAVPAPVVQSLQTNDLTPPPFFGCRFVSRAFRRKPSSSRMAKRIVANRHSRAARREDDVLSR